MAEVFHSCHFLENLLVALLLTIVAGQGQDLCRPAFGYETFLNVLEDVPIGSVVLTLNTTGPPDQIQLSLTNNSYFGFNVTNEALYVKHTLDADETDTSLELTIQCNAKDQPPIDISVTINMQDVNDNPPVFALSHYSIYIGETTAVNSTIQNPASATDEDSSYLNNAVFYSILPGPFSDYISFLQPQNSPLRLMKALDFETVQNFTLTIMAKNDLAANKLNSTTLLTIFVVDEDDLNPIFSSQSYFGTVLENSPAGTTVNVTPTIEAKDGDRSIDAPIRYSFHAGQATQDLFLIDPITAVVQVAKYILADKFSLVLQATQTDNPSRVGIALLMITVKVVNSNAPKFQNSLYQAFVSEAVPVGTNILFVSAEDEDFGTSVQYGIEGGGDLFNISKDSGAIVVLGSLDFEARSFYAFNVTATDGTLTSSARVEVTVLDAKDHAPVITNDNLVVNANRDQKTPLITLKVEDDDSVSQWTFRLENYKGLFTVDNAGNVSISAAPADLGDSQYLLVVVVADVSQPSRSSFATVTVNFPPLSVTQTAVTVIPASINDSLAIALGVIAAVFLIVIIILLIFIYQRRKKSSDDANQTKVMRPNEAKGLRFKDKFKDPAKIDINFRGDKEETSDGGTTVQHGPLKDDGLLNYGFMPGTNDPENDRDMNEIHIETEVIPYMNSDAYTTDMNEDSSEYSDTLPQKHPFIMNELVGFEHNTSSDESGDTNTLSSIDGHHQLMSNGHYTHFKGPKVGSGQKLALSSFAKLDPADAGLTPREHKQELTVYF